MRKIRREMTIGEIKEKSGVIAKSLFEVAAVKTARTVCVYISAFNEPDTHGIIEILLSMGKRVAVPVTDMESVTLSLSYIDDMADLVKGAYGIYEPAKIKSANEKDMDVVITPGLAFDRYGGRMGFGKGYYDRLFESTDAVRIGLCYGYQLHNEIPTEPHDAAMDIIITEKEILEIQL